MALSRTLDRVGLVLGGRYRLLSPIGTGASASVYLADDVTLRRRVAVKVLHEALAEDEAFLRRFQAEAQAAAALNHPHIMSVYDWGDTGEWPYLVMEHLGGGSVRAVLDAGPALSLSQALIVGLETARGLDYAHRRGFVHRDIKPANLLFDDEGRLRIADFGLARALAEAAWTEPMGAVLGTARYASPEQAQGASLDGRSDVYSLALVLIEAVTGAVPFRSDTTIGTLMARVDHPLPVPAAMGPLRPALEAAGRPDPRDRIDAAELGAALLAAAERLDRPEPIPLPGATLPPDQLGDRHPTDVAGRAGTAAAAVPEPVDDITGIVDLRVLFGTDEADPDHPFNWQDDSDLTGRRTKRSRRRDRGDGASRDDTAGRGVLGAAGGADSGGGAAGGGAAGGDPASSPLGVLSGADRGRRRGRRLAARTILIALLVVGIVGGGGFAGWWYLVRIPVHTVPSLVGKPVAASEQLAAANKWRVERTPPAYADGTAAGQVLAQVPTAGTDLAEQQMLRLTVSLGPMPIPVPADLAGRSLDEAGQVLTAAGLVVGSLERRFDEDKPLGTVLALASGTPAEVAKGGAVGLVVSAGPEPRTIPDDLVGRSTDAATARLGALGLRPSIEEKFDDLVPKGQVMATVPGAGLKAEKGSVVALTVSKGPAMVAVPNVTGLPVVDAATKLEAVGLVVSGTQGSPTRLVAFTSPPAGTMVRKGSSVTISTA